MDYPIDLFPYALKKFEPHAARSLDKKCSPISVLDAKLRRGFGLKNSIRIHVTFKRNGRQINKCDFISNPKNIPKKNKIKRK